MTTSTTCVVCKFAIEPGQPQTHASNVPPRLRALEGKPVHLRCHGDWTSIVLARPARAGRPAPAAAGELPAGLLFAADIAKSRGISERQARRWLGQLEVVHGAAAVGRVGGRRGPQRFTTDAALKAVGPAPERGDRGVDADTMKRILRRLSALERALGIGDADV